MEIQKLSENLISEINKCDAGFIVDVGVHKNGDFGDLIDIDFSNGRLMGHIALWSNGYVFYNLFDDTKSENWEIIEETHLDASALENSEIKMDLDILFSKIREYI
ncbi:hypothetical protein [Agrobacterium vitis]|uniref:Uncharacterized protein n=1 Tax=Agrobacterium vitis TaxID=373 RepID=A0AAE2UUT0_AGRVI|nr:hypothetical protein [Agrobacterium vitis]MBF2715070.1 hypothetical protein [Agrobacterium vitis]